MSRKKTKNANDHDWSCDDCRFWQEIVGLSEGSCRRNPPRQDFQTGNGRWPHTKSDDWCGEFGPKFK
jgi:hypothetical protein